MAASLTLAQESAASGGLAAFLPLILVAGLFFLLILPQRRMRKAQAQLQEALVLGDRVRTAGGLHGTITQIDEATVLLELEAGTVRVERRAVVAQVEA